MGRAARLMLRWIAIVAFERPAIIAAPWSAVMCRTLLFAGTGINVLAAAAIRAMMRPRSVARPRQARGGSTVCEMKPGTGSRAFAAAWRIAAWRRTTPDRLGSARRLPRCG